MNLERLGWIILALAVLLGGSPHKPPTTEPVKPSPAVPDEPQIDHPEGEPDTILNNNPTLPLPSHPGACLPSRAEGLSLSPSQRQGFFHRLITRRRP
jgi:hypothetical protein